MFLFLFFESEAPRSESALPTSAASALPWPLALLTPDWGSLTCSPGGLPAGPGELTVSPGDRPPCLLLTRGTPTGDRSPSDVHSPPSEHLPTLTQTAEDRHLKKKATALTLIK